MASALLGALAPAAISALTSGGGSSSGGGGSNLLGSLVQEGVKKSSGIMGGIGSFVSDLLHGKGFKESLAGGIDTMIGRKPTESGFQETIDAFGMTNKSSPGVTPVGNTLSRLGIKASRSTDPEHEGRYIVAVMPMSTFKQMVIVYMAQQRYPQSAIEAVVAEIDAAMKETVTQGPTRADQNRAIGQMYSSVGAQPQYGFPMLAPANVTSRSADYMFPKYDQRPTPSPTAALQQSPPTPGGPAVPGRPVTLPAGSISTSTGATSVLPPK